MRNHLRTILYGVIIFFLLYIIVFRRRSPQLFLTLSNINEYTQQKNLNNTHLHRIPRIIHQTWKTNNIPVRWNKTVESVRQLNANQFEYRLWTDDDMHKFVREKEPHIYQHIFLNYPFNIQRIDSFRYIILYHLGGIYMDLDNGCNKSLDSLVNVLEVMDSKSLHLAAFPRTTPAGLSNDFMISTKGHPFFQMLMSRLSRFNHNYLINYLTVMLSTGSLYLSINEFYFDKTPTQSAIRIVDEVLYQSVYIWHTPGSSWHGRDARTISYIYCLIRDSPPIISYSLIVTIIFILLFLLYRYRFRRQKKELYLQIHEQEELNR
jgi:mannosyltransferase OCH1-like enzyme